MFASDKEMDSKQKLNIKVDPEATNQYTLVTLLTEDPIVDEVHLKLPEKSTYDQEQTAKLKQQSTAFQYDENNQLLIIEWSGDSSESKREAKFVLSDLEEAENNIQAIGLIEKKKVAEAEETFQVNMVEENKTTDSKENKSDEPEKETDKRLEEDGNKAETNKEEKPEKTNQSNINEEDKNETAEEKQSKDELTKTEKERTTENNVIKEIETPNKKQTDKKDKKKASTDENTKVVTPFVGDLNTDIDLSPYKTTVESGKAAMYKLVLKTTGSQKLYEDSTLTVKLPITDYTQFTQDVNELEIAGVVPVYNEADHTLVYEFSDQLRAGETYEKIIKVKTENLISPNGAELNAVATLQVTDKEQTQEFVDDATVRINASGSVSVSKKYKETRLGGNVQKAPFPGSYTIWDIKVSIPKKDVGQMLLKEDSKIVITDTFSRGLTYYDVMNNTPEPTVSGRTLTWELDAPSIAEQMEADGEFFTVDLRVRLQVNNNNNLIGTTQENNVHLSATFIDDNTISESTRDTITIVSRDVATGEIEGNYYVPVHIGPSNGNGGLGNNDLKNPNPIVYDDALLAFSHGIAPLFESKHGDFQQYTTIYRIDPNLIFVKLSTPKGFYYRPNTLFPPQIPLVEQPRFNIVAMVNGQLRVLVENAETNREYTRSDLGLLQTDNISQIRYNFTYAPSGMVNASLPKYFFNVKEGYTGEVVNTFNVYGKDANGDSFNYLLHQEGRDTIAGPRSATIAPRPTNQPPIATVGVELLEHHSGEVVHGENRMKVTLKNESSSILTMSEQLESVVLLPPGVILNTDPNATYTAYTEYTDNDGKTTQEQYEIKGQYEIISDDYNGSGRQLVKIKWDEDRIRIGWELTAELDVSISEGAPNTLTFDVYGFSGDEELRVPSTSGTSITDTILQTDEDDLNGDGVTDQPRLKSGNIYTIRGEYDLQTEKWVKGKLDNEWTNFGQTEPGGKIDYKLKLTNTTGKDITTMTLIDVLPSVGDLGITDNIARGSQFTPLMTGPIELPAEWQGKVNVYYSTAKNPERDDLIRHTKYPETTTPLSNPEGAESPNWMTEADVEDWNTIHSFKIELIDGETWIKGVDMEVLFSMKAPEANDVEASLLDKNIEPKERAAWNSFAVATDHGQPVEPAQVGVYMNYEVEEPEVEKTVNEQKEAYELINRHEQFTWEVKYEFGNYTGNWESVSLSDQINELLEIGHVTVIDQNGTDVTDNGELTISENNLVTFDLKKKDGSFKYLQNQTYTMIIESQIKESATNEELLPYIQKGGIPNQAELIINDDPKPSNEVKVKPPALKGSLDVIKIDKDSKEVLAGAEFELRDENGEVVATGTTNSEGKLVFNDLPLGKYQLVEIKAPEGYRLLKKPLDVEITAEHLEVELEVENSKNGWELPTTGGIGTIIFYGLGALLMIGALLLLLKRKKPTKQTEE